MVFTESEIYHTIGRKILAFSGYGGMLKNTIYLCNFIVYGVFC